MNNYEDAKVFTEDNVMESVTQNKTDSVTVVARGNEDLAVIDSMVATAQRYPRNVKTSLAELREIALASPKIAESCFYKLPRGGKIIPGKSVRLAEMAQYCWGHVYAGARPVAIERDVVVAEGSAFDCQRNNRSSVTIRRSILGKGGKRYNADMINITMLAALSIAKREAIYDIIPEALLEPIYEDALRIAVGDIKTLPERRSLCLGTFSKMGITAEQVLAALEVDAVEGIDLEKLELMQGIYQGIKSGDVSIDEIFPPTQKPVVTGATETLKGDVGKAEPVKDESTKKDKPEKESEPTKETPAEKSKEQPTDTAVAPTESETQSEGSTEPTEQESASDDPVERFVPLVKDVPVTAVKGGVAQTADDNDLFKD